MTQQCESCRHWNQHPDDSSAECQLDGERLGLCESPLMIRGYHVDVPDGGAQVEDDVGFGIVTDRHFGCVNWAAKP